MFHFLDLCLFASRTTDGPLLVDRPLVAVRGPRRSSSSVGGGNFEVFTIRPDGMDLWILTQRRASGVVAGWLGIRMDVKNEAPTRSRGNHRATCICALRAIR
jgi:hypothetical protein